jgi:hypothetical protein
MDESPYPSGYLRGKVPLYCQEHSNFPWQLAQFQASDDVTALALWSSVIRWLGWLTGKLIGPVRGRPQNPLTEVLEPCVLDGETLGLV